MTTTNDENYTPFGIWQAGDMSDVQALRTLAFELGETESELAPLVAEKERLRDQLSQVLAHHGEPAFVIPGFGKLELTQPTVVKGWDGKALAGFLDELLFEAPELAARLARCKTENGRAGSLRVTRIKGTRS
jgi:hypothetical protein